MPIAAKLDTIMEKIGDVVNRRAEQISSTASLNYNHISDGGFGTVEADERALTGGVLLSKEERQNVYDAIQLTLEMAGFAAKGEPGHYKDKHDKVVYEDLARVSMVTSDDKFTGKIAKATYFIEATNFRRLAESWEAITEISRKVARRMDSPSPEQSQLSR